MEDQSLTAPAGQRAQNGRVTLKDISEAAGVSVSTASRVLSGAPGISPAVRARVNSTAERLNYAGTATGASALTIISNLNVMETGAGDFVQALMRGIEKEATELGIGLTLSLLGSGRLASVNTDASSACLLLSMQDDAVIDQLVERGIPSVIVNGRETRMRLDTLAPANRTGGYLAARHLIELGHRRIMTMAYSPRPTIRDRLDGYRKAMQEAGVSDLDDLVVEVSAMRTDVAYAVTKARLEAPGGPDFTAIQCCNDASAFGVMTAIHEAGLRIPEDISVVGFDDIPTAGMASVPLTTIQVDCDLIGASAVRRLVERIRNPSIATTYTEFAVRLVVRESTGPAPRA